MPTPNHAAAYEDLYKLFERALTDPKGIRVRFASNGDATHARLRMNVARQINRADNAAIFPDPSHPLHGKSVYDAFIFKVQDNYVIIERVDGTEYEVESLSDPVLRSAEASTNDATPGVAEAPPLAAGNPEGVEET